MFLWDYILRDYVKGDPYVFGVDPAWQAATNKIIFLNGYKMKISLIFGLIHMVFAVTLSAWQKVIKRKYAEIFVEFIPQIIFLVFIFCYLILLIFFKWVSYSANVNLHGDPNNDRSEHCAPNLLITFINMMMFKAQYTKMDIMAKFSSNSANPGVFSSRQPCDRGNFIKKGFTFTIESNTNRLFASL